jgi:hypothetical protein
VLQLRAFENRVLKGICVLKRDEVTGGWRKPHNEELHKFYCSPSITRKIKTRRMRWTGSVARMGHKRNAYKILVGNPEGKKPLRIPRRKWEDGIKMDRREILVGWCSVEWIDLAQDS